MRYNFITQKNELSGFFNLRKQFETFGNGYVNEIQFLNDVYGDKEVVKLPCRKCVNCQLNRAQEWAIRNTLEASEYDESDCLFITLTYDNEKASHLLKHVITKNGKVYENLSLWRPDLQKFIKKLRDVFDKNKIRFYGCGEYGGVTFRPHYHLLLYGISLDDILRKVYKNKTYSLILKRQTKNGSFYYSELLEEEVWQKGFVDISTFSPYTAGYVSRYCTKKVSEKKKIDAIIFYDGLHKEFNCMSLKPAIAKNYAIKNLDKIYKNDEFLYHFNQDTLVLKPFSYWDRLYDIERPDEYKFIKENRKEFAKLHKYFEQLETNLNISEYLRNQEDIEYKKLSERKVI